MAGTVADSDEPIILIPFIAFFLVISATCPVHAGILYTDGSPKLSVAIAGTNEFAPGDEVSIPLLIANTGLNEYKYVSPSIVTRDDLPSTAKHIVVTLHPGDAPVIVTSDSRMAGDLSGGSSVTAGFDVTIDPNAPSGMYTLLTTLNYTYLKVTEQFGTDAMLYIYTMDNVTVPVPIIIKPKVTIDIIEAIPDDVNVGTEGYMTIRFRNTGSENGKNAVVRVLRNGESPIIPLESGVFIGDFPPGSTVSCKYRVLIDPKAKESTYPVDIAIVYENPDGDTVTSQTETVGIPVDRKIEFRITSPPIAIHPGQKKTITVTYRNTGTVPVYNAEGRITAVSPFTSSEDITYLGDIPAGGTVIAEYEVRVDSGATTKNYGLDSEIRYQDSFNTTYVSNSMKVEMHITTEDGLASIIEDPVRITVVTVAIIIVLFMVYRYRKKRS